MHLIYSKIDNYKDNELNNYINNIYTIKKNRILKTSNDNSKKRMIIGELLLKILLKKYYNLDYNKLDFYLNDYNKPYIKNKTIFYNISHSSLYVICGISKKEIGIDIEKIRQIDLRTINQFATQNEKKYILSNDKDIEKRLFEIYTLKEAYFKMLGTNLSNIKKIEFFISNKKIICSDKSIDAKLNYDIPNYIIAICEQNH